MKHLEEKIKENSYISKKLKAIYLGDDLEFDKSKELQRQQDIAYKKMIFFKKLKEEMGK